MLITKEVEVNPSGKSIQYYRNLGYDAKYHEPLIVKVEDLQNGSHAMVEVLCDYCKKEIFSVAYFDYVKETKLINKHACKNCRAEKIKEANIKKYGVDNASRLDYIKEKRKNTFISRYGVETPLQNKEIMKRVKETNLSKYGFVNPSQVPEFREKVAATAFKHYGVYNPSQSEEIKQKVRDTNIQKYGVPCSMQSTEVKSKANKTLCLNGSVRTSSQQLYLHSIYGGEINYPVSYCAIDICLPDEKLCIEYDGGGHDLRVKLGDLTQKEFNQKEIIRNNIIKRNGYKQMKIISSTDKLPSDNVLLKILSDARQYFIDYPNHSWIEFNIDNSTVRNAENKNGISYDFGDLRKITQDVA